MELVAGVLRHDLVVQRGYTYSFGPGGRLPCPVTAVGWDSDDVVPSEQALEGWERCADTEFLELSGGHFSYFDWPSPLTEVLQDRLAHARSG
jgi:surfactin synthase thioesterase subunit